MAKKLITRAELAEILSVKVRTIDSWSSDYGLPRIKINSSVRYDLDEVMKWVEKKNEERK